MKRSGRKINMEKIMICHNLAREADTFAMKPKKNVMKNYPNVIVPKHGRGYFGIGIYGPKMTKNIGTLWRTADIFGADFMFTIGKRYETMRSDKRKSWKHIPLFEYEDFSIFRGSLPKDSRLVGIELDEHSQPLMTYKHQERAVYLLGAEDFGLPEDVIASCDDIIQLPGDYSLNVSVAGSIVIYDGHLDILGDKMG